MANRVRILATATVVSHAVKVLGTHGEGSVAITVGMFGAINASATWTVGLGMLAVMENVSLKGLASGRMQMSPITLSITQSTMILYHTV